MLWCNKKVNSGAIYEATEAFRNKILGINE